MKKRQIALLLILSLLPALLGACGAPSILGRWRPVGDNSFSVEEFSRLGVKAESISLEFLQDGHIRLLADGKDIMEAVKAGLKSSGASQDMLKTIEGLKLSMSYKLEGSQITITMEVNGQQSLSSGSYTINGDELTITSEGRESRFVRVK